MWATNTVWLAYSIKIMNVDLIVINSLGTFIASCFLVIYLYVKSKVARLSIHIIRLVIGIGLALSFSSNLTSPWTNGLLATLMSMT